VSDPIEALVFYVVFLFSATFHEAAHAWAAMRGGDLTAYHGGQVSLDPMPHIRREPFGMVVLPILTVLISGWPFGFASAPYDPNWARSHPRRAAWMALAGPGANLALILAAAFVIRTGMMSGYFHAPASIGFAHVTASDVSQFGSAAAFLVSTFFSLNLVLFILNLLPVPPLDGSGALPLVLNASATERWQEWMSHPRVGWIGILVAWWIFDEIFGPIFLAAVNLLYPEFGYS
jgi:Zn-dependent protease